jgi:type IV secretory pathway VirB2 component (pilin)
MRKQNFAIICMALMLCFVLFQLVYAIDFNRDISSQDKAAFDEMLEPVLKIYNLVKYSATVISVVVLLFAGITYITSGSDPGRREQAKSMGMYVIVGLMVIWAAPLIVNFIVG